MANADIEDTAMVPLVENNVLAYMCRVFHECSQEALKRTISSYFDASEIHDAKECLWTVYGDEALGQKPKRVGSNKKPAYEFELEDLLAALKVMDQNKLFDTKARFCACDVLHVPPYKPEEVNVASIVERVAALELQLKEARDDITSNKIQITCVDADVQKALSQSANMASVAPRPEVTIPLDTAKVIGEICDHQVVAVELPGDGVARNAAEKMSQTGGVQITVADIVKDNKIKPISMKALPVCDEKNISDAKPTGPITSDMVSNALTDLANGFSYQASYAKKLRVMGKKSDNNIKVKGAPQVRTLAETNITKDTLDENVEKLVKRIGPVESFRKAYNLDKMRTKQFTFQVLEKDMVTFLDPDKWPSGVCCRAWNTNQRRDQKAK